MKLELTRRRGGIDILMQAEKVNLASAQLRYPFNQVF